MASVRAARRAQRGPSTAGDSELAHLAEGIEVALLAFAVSALFYPVAYHFYFYLIAGLAAAAGPIVGGALVTGPGWRAVFFVNVLPALGFGLLALTARGSQPERSRAGRLDVPGAVLLAVYSGGLGLAFLLAAVGFTQAMGAFRWLRDHYKLIRIAGGVTLVALGLLLFFHKDWWLNVFLSRLLDEVGLTNV